MRDLSPTPPVECLSTAGARATTGRARRPTRSIASRTGVDARRRRGRGSRSPSAAPRPGSRGSCRATAPAMRQRISLAAGARRRRACARSARRRARQRSSAIGAPGTLRAARRGRRSASRRTVGADVGEASAVAEVARRRARRPGDARTSGTYSRVWSVRRRGRVVAVVGGQSTSRSSGAQRRAQVGQRAVELAQAAVVARGVVAVPVEHVEVSTRLAKMSPSSTSPQRLAAICSMPVGVALGVDVDSSMPWPAKMSRDLADADRRGCPAARSRREVVRPRRREREVVAVVGARDRRRLVPTNGRAMTRPTACGLVRISRAMRQTRVQLVERHDLLVRGDLEDRVGRRVDDHLPVVHVLVAERAG